MRNKTFFRQLAAIESLFQNNSKFIPVGLGVSIFCWRSLFAWQGLDFTDLGFSLSLYQQFYTSPEGNAYAMNLWLTAFIGHWIGETLGGTVVAYNLASAFVCALTGVIAYFGIQGVIGRSWLIAGCVFLTFIFATKSNYHWINYNELTALFFITGAVALFRGLHLERPKWLLVAGWILGANLFVRIPNLMGFSLVLGVLIHATLYRYSLRKCLNQILVFVSGYGLGIASISVLIFLHGHSDIYLQSLEGILGKAVEAGSSHSASNLVNLVLRDHLYAFLTAIAIISAGRLTWHTVAFRPLWLRAFVVLLAAACFFISFSLFQSWRWIMPGLIYAGSLWIAYKESGTRPELGLLIFLAVLVYILVPLGSAMGIYNASYGSWLVLPLLLVWFWRGGTNAVSFLASFASWPRLAAATISITLVSFSILSSWGYTYRDSSKRLSMLHTINHDRLAGTHTTAERARVVTEVLNAAEVYIKPGDYVLAYPSMPMFHFLTNTRGWLNSSWPALYGENEIKWRLDEQKVRSAKLPVVVRALGSTRNFTWPDDVLPSVVGATVTSTNSFETFLHGNGYTVAWTNGFFEILTPGRQ
jgi:hypothetical protein